MLGQPFFSKKNCPTNYNYHYKHLLDYVLTKDFKSSTYVSEKQFAAGYNQKLPYKAGSLKTTKKHITVNSRLLGNTFNTPLTINYLNQTKQTIFFNNNTNTNNNLTKPSLMHLHKHLTSITNTKKTKPNIALFSQKRPNFFKKYNCIKYFTYSQRHNKYLLNLSNNSNTRPKLLKLINSDKISRTLPKLSEKTNLNIKLFLKKEEIILDGKNETTHNHKDYFLPTRISSFSLKHPGIFASKNLNIYKNMMSIKYKFLYKSRLSQYSFLKPNQIKTTILRRRSSVVLYKLLNSTGLITTSLLNTQLEYKNTLSNYKNYTPHRNKPLNKHGGFSEETKDISVFMSEVKIPRIRFKPGYQRM
jgi:hypothetical protein